jgi:site-specific recombinase XerC
MRGAPARAIQELAGRRDLTTTQRYMHLSPAAIESAIRLVELPAVATSVATSSGEIANVSV